MQGTFCRYWYPWLDKGVVVGGSGTLALKTAWDFGTFCGVRSGLVLGFVNWAYSDSWEKQLTRKTVPRSSLVGLHDAVSSFGFSGTLLPNSGWLLQPVLSLLLFKLVPLRFQGLAGIAQALVGLSTTHYLRRDKLQLNSDHLAAIDAAIASKVFGEGVTVPGYTDRVLRRPPFTVNVVDEQSDDAGV